MIYRTTLNLIISSILYSCASQIPLTGGDKDTQAPTLINSTPSSPNNLNYSKNYITFQFDENIIENNLEQEITIQPETAYKYSIKKNTLTLTFLNSLTPQTTYNVHLGQSIKDIHEGTKINDVDLFFSTGNYLDSNEIQGSINYNYGSSKEPILIGLYENIDSVNPINSKPLYYTNTQPGSQFTIQHLPNKTYKIFAFNDRNKNKQWDYKNESIAFTQTSIPPHSSKTIHLYLTKQDSTKITLLTTRQFNNGYVLTYNRTPINYTIQNQSNILHHLKTNKLYIYPTTPLTDTLTLSTQITDSLENVIFNDVQLIPHFKPSQLTKLITNIEPINRTLHQPNQFISIQLKEPLDTNKCHFNQITLNKKSPIQYNYNYPALELHYSENLLDTNQFYIHNNTLQSIYGNIQDSIITVFKTYKTQNFGNLSGNLPKTDHQKIIQLLDQNNNIYKTLIQQKSQYNFTNIDPGTYTLRFIHDLNNNNIYDNGNFFNNQLPETIEYFPKPIQIRANWDLESINIDH